MSEVLQENINQEYKDYKIVEEVEVEQEQHHEIFVECFDPKNLQKILLDSSIRVTWIYCVNGKIGKQQIEVYDVPMFGLFYFNGNVWQRVGKKNYSKIDINE